ncbi:MAG: HAD-IA family hydrolase [Clostridia bacterium]|nr:HAD-IA family hydrolase [Clostridia bacterium]
MNKYRFIIWDLDGTLLDTLDDLTNSINVTMKRYSLPTHSRDAVRQFVGHGIKNLMKSAVGEAGENVGAQAFEFFTGYYAEHCRENTAPYEGVLSLISRLKQAGYGQAVVSNKADFAVKILCKEHFEDIIDIAIGENEKQGVRKKPCPDSVFEAMRLLGANKNNTVYVGDSEVDIETARNAGIPCISVSWGFRDIDQLENAGADIICNDISALEGEL